MSTQQKLISHVNAHGKQIRTLKVLSGNTEKELSFQSVNGQWTRFKQVVRTIH